MNADTPVIGGSGGDDRAPIDGHGKNETLVVVGVFTDEIYPARRTKEAWGLVIQLLESVS
jgi:hypothetical protein